MSRAATCIVVKHELFMFCGMPLSFIMFPVSFISALDGLSFSQDLEMFPLHLIPVIYKYCYYFRKVRSLPQICSDFLMTIYCL
jgi:hypothetical protein